MIERRPGLDLLSHLILLLGVSIVAFPLYLTFVASTQTAEQISRSIPMSMVPGSHFWETYRLALFGGETSLGSKVPAVWPMMQYQFDQRTGHLHRQNCHFLAVCICLGLFSFSVQAFFLLDDFYHAHAAC